MYKEPCEVQRPRLKRQAGEEYPAGEYYDEEGNVGVIMDNVDELTPEEKARIDEYTEYYDYSHFDSYNQVQSIFYPTRFPEFFSCPGNSPAQLHFLQQPSLEYSEGIAPHQGNSNDTLLERVTYDKGEFRGNHIKIVCTLNLAPGVII